VKTYIEKDLNKTYLVLEGEEGETEDYQTVMLRENEIPGVLRTDISHLDNQIYYHYDISGKQTFASKYEREMLRCEDMKTLVIELLDVIQNLQKYMLDGRGVLLDPEFIFCEREHFYFCYYPSHKEGATEAFHRLTEFFVREVNYSDEEGVRFAYTFHKATMEENYSIEKIMKSLLPVEETPEQDLDEVTFVEYTEEIESTSEQEEVAEELDFWGKAKGFWKKVRTNL
jgi:hypothetical protein